MYFGKVYCGQILQAPMVGGITFELDKVDDVFDLTFDLILVATAEGSYSCIVTASIHISICILVVTMQLQLPCVSQG